MFFAAAVVVGSASAFAQADVMKACGAEWQQLKESKQVKPGQTWNSYLADCRKAKAAAKPAAAAPAAAAPAAAAPATPAKPAAAPAKPAAAPAAAGAAKFPAAVDPKYAKESAGKQRMHTCLDQYNANKATNGNGGLKWIEKGGGYYSQCNKALGGGGND